MNIGVVGNGASSIITVLQLLRKGVKRVEWYGGSSILGGATEAGEYGTAFGVAYRTTTWEHLLNVEAHKMTPMDGVVSFPEFLSWHLCELKRGDTHDEAFAPRALYRKYLLHLLHNDKAGDAGKAVSNYRLIPKSYALRASQLSHLDSVILCLGACHREVKHEYYPFQYMVQNPWTYDYARLENERKNGRIVILGTGLTALDTAISIWKVKPRVHIDFVSRHGMLPQPHMPELDKPASGVFRIPTTVSQVLELRDSMAKAGFGWRSFMASMRPHWNDVWTKMDKEQRELFLRDYRHIYDVHRHKMVAQTQKVLDEHSYKVWKLDEYDWTQSIVAIFNATGIDTDPSRNPLLVSMESAGLVKFADSKLGLSTSQTCKVDSVIESQTWCVGAYLKDTFWECTAIPDIKNHIQTVVEEVT